MNTAQTAQSWIVVADDAAATGLVEVARTLGTEVVAVVAGRRAVADAVAGVVDRVLWLGEPGSAPVEAFAPDVARLVAEATPRTVVGATTPGGRALLGAVSAALRSPVLAGVERVELSGDDVVVTRSVLGGISQHRTAVSGGPAVLAVDAGAVVVLSGAAPAAGSAPVEEVPATPLPAQVVEVRPTTVAGVDLGAARVVVGVGRGLKAREDVALISGLAGALGGEVACSRPLAEGVDWLPKDRYIGISGQRVSPELYVAVGISGQLQHMVGVREAKVIVAVNSDKAAPVFAQCDYGIVGDLYQVVPALTAALGGAA
ncbi:electron transfer flavoprotein subunit alpha/FixB family protein [Cellulomonas sp. SG140]|uniref:electron transfer flavoprotein subunit alpha/FixB family protein n=1 Tax=Cellulomonas sp. SG140 TaxID=2976536 RepID=UPI0021E81953|nr:electron transfer flavoprotein subunit alpha/FixB family protein [Cellulomonas sp. SG140]